MELVNSSLSTLWSVLTVALVLGVVADEGIGAFLVHFILETLDSSVLFKEGSDISLCETLWEILGVDIVVNSSEVALVSWLVLDCLVLFSLIAGCEGKLCSCLLLEAHKPVATGGVVRVERDFQGLDFSVLGEVFLKFFWSQVLGNFPNENVLVDNLFRIGSKKVIIVGKSATWLSWSKLEVAELLASGLEFIFFWNCHDGGIKGSVDVTSDLWISAKDDVSLLFEVVGKLGAGSEIFG